MTTKLHNISHKQSERGQSMVTVALSLGVFLLLMSVAAVFLFAVFTASTMESYDGGGGFFGTFETQGSNEFSKNVSDPDNLLSLDLYNGDEQLK